MRAGLIVSLIVSVIVAAFVLVPQSSGATKYQLREAVKHHRAQAWNYADIMGRPRHPTRYHERKAARPYLRWLLNTWRARHIELRLEARRVPNLSFWLCVHGREGAWNDPNPPYYGGLQMGAWFMRTYGWNLLQRKGTADHWTPLEQLWVAARAWKREGYSIAWLYGQWPNTAPPCR